MSPMRLAAQWYFDLELRPTHPRPYRWIPRPFRTAFRLLLIRTGDPVCFFKVGNYRITAPISHELPFVLRTWPHYMSSLGRLAILVRDKYPDLTIVDIGANIGDTAAFIHSHVKCPILCIEGHPRYLELLRANIERLGLPVTIAPTFVAGTEARKAVHVQSFSGTAEIVEVVRGTDFVNFQTLTHVLQLHRQFLSSKLLKIDTDGFDCEIIQYSGDVLRKTKPIVYFEYDLHLSDQRPRKAFDVFATLASWGYAAFMFHSNVGDYLATVRADQVELLRDIDGYFRGRKSLMYCDVTAFPSDDLDICEKARAGELTYFERFR